MADEDAGQEVEREARSMGWLPKEEYKGRADDWVPADTFVDKGKQILPIVQKHNEQLQAQLRARDAELGTLKSSVKNAEVAIAALQASHEEDVKEQVEAARVELKAQIATASKDGDHDGLAEATAKLTELDAATAVAAREDKGNKGNGTTQNTDKGGEILPEVASWLEAHQEFAKDQRRVALARVFMNERRIKGDTRTGKAILDDVATDVESFLGGNTRADKVDGGNGGGDRSDVQGGKTYADLPGDAKAACERLANKLVGPNRAHKDLASWQKSYAKQFFEMN